MKVQHEICPRLYRFLHEELRHVNEVLKMAYNLQNKALFLTLMS